MIYTYTGFYNRPNVKVSMGRGGGGYIGYYLVGVDVDHMY
jgi:hypothetical protein